MAGRSTFAVAAPGPGATRAQQARSGPRLQVGARLGVDVFGEVRLPVGGLGAQRVLERGGVQREGAQVVHRVDLGNLLLAGRGRGRQGVSGGGRRCGITRAPPGSKRSRGAGRLQLPAAPAAPPPRLLHRVHAPQLRLHLLQRGRRRQERLVLRPQVRLPQELVLREGLCRGQGAGRAAGGMGGRRQRAGCKAASGMNRRRAAQPGCTARQACRPQRALRYSTVCCFMPSMLPVSSRTTCGDRSGSAASRRQPRRRRQ